MSQSDPTASAQATVASVTALQKRVRGLEKVRNFAYAILGLAAIAGAWFGLTSSTLADRLTTLEEAAQTRTRELEVLREKIAGSGELVAQLRGRAEEASTVAQNALLKAGSLELAVGEAREAARKADERAAAAQLATEVARAAAAAGEGSAERAGSLVQQIQEIFASVTSTKSTVGDFARRQQQYDQLIATLYTRVAALESPAAAPRPAARRVIRYVVAASSATLVLSPGLAALDLYTISGSSSVTELFVPDEAQAIVTVEGSSAKVIIAKSLRGRVEVLQGGSRASVEYR